MQAKPQVTAARPIYTRWCQGHIEVLGSRVRVIQEHALSKMVQCSPNKSKCVQHGKKMSLFFQNGPKWSKMVKIGPNMVHTFTKLFKMLQNGPKWSKDQERSSRPWFGPFVLIFRRFEAIGIWKPNIRNNNLTRLIWFGWLDNEQYYLCIKHNPILPIARLSPPVSSPICHLLLEGGFSRIGDPGVEFRKMYLVLRRLVLGGKWYLIDILT